MKKYYLLFFILLINLFNSQTELVRWTKNDLAPTSVSNVSALPISSAGGVGISPTTWDQSFFMISGLSNSSNIDTNKYIQFTIAPANSYKITLQSLKLRYRNQSGNSKFEIRYSTNSDFSSPQTLYTAAVTDSNWHDLSQSNFVNNTVASGKTLYIRLYVYETYNNFHIAYTPQGGVGTGPNITGTVAADMPTAPVANNDSYSVAKNNDGEFNILANDVSSSAFTTVAITQQPVNGTVTVNGTSGVTYKPTVGFTGTDTFKYTVSNSVGVSNTATVSINVVNNVAASLVRWNNTDNSASIYNTKVTSGNITSPLAISAGDYWENSVNYKMYQIAGWPSTTTVDKTKYLQFTVSPKNGYKLSLSDFNFLVRMGGNSSKIRIDYALNSAFTNSANILPETTLGSNWTNISLNNFPAPIATDGQILYLRVYVYNTYNEFQIKFHPNNNVGPAFNGIVEYSSTAPLAYDDTVTTSVNNDININALSNDDYSNQVTSVSITQPSHGVTVLNADNTINYMPAKDYSGADAFSYNITNKYGVSNYAVVTLNVVANNSSPLIRWENNDYSGTAFQNFIDPAKMTSSGITLSTDTWSTPVYIASNLETGSSVNPSKYVQFILDNKSTTKTIEPKTLSFTGSGAVSYQIRYSKAADFSTDVKTLSEGIFNAGETVYNFNFENAYKLNAGEKLYVRLYLFNSYSHFVMQYYSGATGPQIDGLFYNSTSLSTDTIWQNAAQPHWSNGVPTAEKHAILDTKYDTSANGNFISKNLTVNTGASITIKQGGYITVNGQIINNAGTDKFLIENNANLLQYGSGQNVGNITIQKTAVIPKMGYNYWSSPVAGQNLYQFSDGYNQATGTGTGTPWNRFYVYNEANDYFVTTLANDITLTATSAFQAARGYAIRGKNSFPDKITSASTPSLFEFKGVPQNGDFSFLLKWSNAAHGYNMVGNPYPSNLSFDDLYAANSKKIFGVAYCWTNNDDRILNQQSSNYQGNNYAIYNGTGGTSATYFGYNNRKPNGYISVGQGFIVQARPAGKNQPLIFNDNMRFAENANFYNKGEANKAQKDRFWLEFKSPTNVNNEILIGYMPAATNGYDSDFDTELLAVGTDSFWSILDSKKLGIQARETPLMSEDFVKLGIKASLAGEYAISITDKEGIFDAGQNVYLKDTYLNKVVSLKDGAYVFNTSAGQYDDRFQIIYKNQETLATDNAVKKGIQIYKDLQNFIISSTENLDMVSVYDALGRLIYENKSSKKEILINKNNLPEGLYIIKAKSGNTVTTKKVLK